MSKMQRRIARLIKSAPHMTAQDVAETLRVSRKLVYRAAKEYGVTFRPARLKTTERVRKRILSLARMGASDEDIARRIGFSASTVERIRQRAKVRHNGGVIGPRASKQMHLEIARRHLIHGHSYREIGKHLHVTKGVIAGAVYRARHNNWDLSASVEKEVEAV